MMQACQEGAITGRAPRVGAPSSRETHTRRVRPMRLIIVDPAQMMMRRMSLSRRVKRRELVAVSVDLVLTSVTKAIVNTGGTEMTMQAAWKKILGGAERQCLGQEFLLQRLKTKRFQRMMARLKSCPDTKPMSLKARRHPKPGSCRTAGVTMSSEVMLGRKLENLSTSL